MESSRVLHVNSHFFAGLRSKTRWSRYIGTMVTSELSVAISRKLSLIPESAKEPILHSTGADK